MANQQNQIKYTDEAGLKYALMQFLANADLRFLGINDNATSATKLETPRNINGVSFDGTTDITITADIDAIMAEVFSTTQE